MKRVHWDCLRSCPACVSVRLWERAAEDGECWVYTGHLDEKGYGRFRVDGRDEYAHRVAYRTMVAEIPDGLLLDHLCRNPRCIRPDHLEPVTSKVNTLRGVSPVVINKQRTHCPADHPYDDANTMVSGGWRHCRTCRNERRRAARRLRALDPSGAAEGAGR